ncbi:MAG: Cys-Gln thioester bond-forming surface protein [Clostridia bacterium]|nr:Cys-Gln thioester bond-forming surface protein [Clostridia bacterium]
MVKYFKNMKRLKLKITSIFLLIALLTLEFSPFAVKATANELQFYSKSAVSVGYDNYNKKNVFYGNATLGGVTAYCIDYTCSLPSGTMTFRDYLSDQGMAILMHGYPNCTPESIGCANDEEAYMATQMALWEVLNRTGESLKAGLIFRVENVTPLAGKEDFYNRSVAAAKKLVAMAETQPYTEVPTLVVNTESAALNYIGSDALMGPYIVRVDGTAKSTVKSITATLENAPASAIITDVNGNAKTSIANGDSVYVRMSGNEETTSFKVKFAADVDRKIGCIYTQPGNVQDYVRLDTIPNNMDLSVTINWTKTSTNGRIELIKVDQDDQPVVGAKFRLSEADGTVIGDFSTGVDGRITYYNVPAGDYILTELEAPEGYVIKSQSTNVTVKAGETSDVKVVNERITGKLVITKVDDANKPLENVTFGIYDEEGYLVTSVTTDAEGKASVNVGYGTYYFKETSAPEGYIMDDTMYKFTVDADNRTFYKTITNDRYKGTIVIVKTDDEQTPLEGVKFNILDAEGNVLITITTNEKGLAGAQNLPYGTYYYQEIEAPENVIMDTNKYEFKIETDGQVVRKDIVNEKIKGSLKILKVNDDDRAIANVKFEILNENKEVVQTLTTGQDGIAVSEELQPGKYFYKEIEAPEGYIVDKTEYPFEITNTGEIHAVKVVNHLAKGQLQITKYDNTGKTLANVKFDILDESKNVVDTITTDENGVAVSKELPLGTYYYKETQAPENVVMDTEEHTFVLTDNGQIIKKTVVNELKQGKLKIIKVDENNEPLAGVKFEILDLDEKHVCYMTTNEEGIAESEELEKGTYYWKEIEAPEGIIVDSSLHEFTIVEDGQNVIENVVNYYNRGQLKITKLVEGTDEPLANVKFAVLDSERNVIEEIVTDENGIAVSSKLPYGTYYFKEIEAPDGYIMDTTEYEFSIIDNDDLIEAVVYNTKAELPVTGGFVSENFIIVLAVSLISIFGYGIITLVKKEEN